MKVRGDERFYAAGAATGFSVLDFWRWSTADLVSNTVRGVLAEFIVAQALGVDTTAGRQEWAPYDLCTTDGVSVEVKSAAYLQSWAQHRPSTIQFGVSKKRVWDAATNRVADEPARTADVYVFALLAHRDRATLDPLNLDQWEFYVLATTVLDQRERSQHSITLPSLQKMQAGLHKFDELRTAVAAAVAK
jgi:hypothetical protein